MSRRRHLLLLAAAVTDHTFEPATLDDRTVWVGKCIHCNTRLVLADDGRSLGEATLEHLWPETQGGTNAVENLAVACARCNREKGRRHDHEGGGSSLRWSPCCAIGEWRGGETPTASGWRPACAR